MKDVCEEAKHCTCGFGAELNVHSNHLGSLRKEHVKLNSTFERVWFVHQHFISEVIAYEILNLPAENQL